MGLPIQGGFIVSAPNTMKKWFCKCVLPNGEVVYLVVRAHTEGQATSTTHRLYTIDYVEDILTPEDMALYVWGDLKKSNIGIITVFHHD